MLSSLLALALAAGSALPADVDPFLRQYAETARFAAGRPSKVTLTPDGGAALFLRSGPRSRVQALWETRLDTGETRALVTAETLAGAAAAPTRDEAARLERQRITARGLTHYELSGDGARILFAVGGRLWLLERATGAVRPLPVEGAIDPRFSPDGRAVAFVRGPDLFVLDVARGTTRRLTRARGDAVSYGVAEFVAQEEMDRDHGYWWSPDGRRLAVAEVDESAVERRLLCDPARPEAACGEQRYPRAGGTNAKVGLLVVPAEGGRATRVRWDAARFPYLATVKWDRGGPLTILVQNRTQTEERLLAVDPGTGATRLLLEERDAAWVNLRQDFPRWLEDGSGFLWVTERSGWPELELRAPTGERRATVVPGAFNFVELAGVDRTGAIWFTGAPDPTQTVLYRVAPGGAPLAVAAGEPGPALRKAVAGRSGDVAVGWSTLTSGLRWAVFSARGEKRAELPGVAEEPPFAPTTELRKVGAGEGLWTALLLPRGARPGAKLPVIVSVYGGPSGPRAVRRPLLLDQWLADQGFAVVIVDGRGTSRRGRAFEAAVKGDFSEIPLADQIAGLQALAEERPELDLSRAGIHGWSFGGYAAALAALKRPDAFRAALAGAPVSEWTDYDTHYTERYLGLPQENAGGYARSSLLPLAGAAPPAGAPEARLLVVHGTADDNVWFSHALKLADALFKAGRRFELVPIAGATHLLPDPLAAARETELLVRFFRESLGAPASPAAPPPAPSAARRTAGGAASAR